MLLLVVFILGYGVATQALLHPVRPFSMAIFMDAFMVPYWEIYGEIQMEATAGERARQNGDRGRGR